MDKSKITVTIPLAEFEKLQELADRGKQIDPKGDEWLEQHKNHVGYIHSLVQDAYNSVIAKKELKEFHFFQSPIGNFLINSREFPEFMATHSGFSEWTKFN